MCECVRGICFPSYMRRWPRSHHTYTNTLACRLCHLWCTQLAWPSVCLPEFPECSPVFLPVLCACLFIFLPVCLSAVWSQATRTFLIASSLLRDQTTVKQSTALLSVARERDKWEDRGVKSYTFLYRHTQPLFISWGHLSQSVCTFARASNRRVKRLIHAFSPHTCVGENKSHSIRVFSLTMGLRPIPGFTAQSLERIGDRHQPAEYFRLLIQVLFCKKGCITTYAGFYWDKYGQDVNRRWYYRCKTLLLLLLHLYIVRVVLRSSCSSLRVWKPVWAEQHVTQSLYCPWAEKWEIIKRGAGRWEEWKKMLRGGWGRMGVGGVGALWLADTSCLCFYLS